MKIKGEPETLNYICKKIISYTDKHFYKTVNGGSKKLFNSDFDRVKFPITEISKICQLVLSNYVYFNDSIIDTSEDNSYDILNSYYKDLQKLHANVYTINPMEVEESFNTYYNEIHNLSYYIDFMKDQEK